MIYDRLDGKCSAQILASNINGVLLDARWLASRTDRGRFPCNNDYARNIVLVQKAYFEQKYGVKL